MAPKVTYCNTPASIADAVSALSAHSVLLIDCEAKELGQPEGVLSLITISGPLADHVFLIDALGAFPCEAPRPHPALAPLLALLSQPGVTKVFWDGRADALELRLVYGLVLTNVLDLQLINVVARARTVTAGRPSPDLIRGFFRSLSTEMTRNPAAYVGIYMLNGLGRTVEWLQLLPKGSQEAFKDPAVVAMHVSGGSALWLARPLPAPLLTYAAHDLTLIALVYAHFMREPWVRSRLAELRAQSETFVGLLGTREEEERWTTLGLKRFMPLGIIDGSGDSEGAREGPRYACECCRRELGADCFVKQVGSGTVRRLSYCRLCSALGQRNGQAQGEWVDL